MTRLVILYRRQAEQTQQCARLGLPVADRSLISNLTVKGLLKAVSHQSTPGAQPSGENARLAAF